MVPPQILQGHGGSQTTQSFVQHGGARGRDQSSLLPGRAGVWPGAEDQVGTAAVGQPGVAVVMTLLHHGVPVGRAEADEVRITGSNGGPTDTDVLQGDTAEPALG